MFVWASRPILIRLWFKFSDCALYIGSQEYRDEICHHIIATTSLLSRTPIRWSWDGLLARLILIRVMKVQYNFLLFWHEVNDWMDPSVLRTESRFRACSTYYEEYSSWREISHPLEHNFIYVRITTLKEHEFTFRVWQDLS